jgi:STE24 endopeptidase
VLESFDVAEAVAAYLSQVPPEAHAKALAYTRGGYWLLLWGTLVSIIVAWILVRWSILARVARWLQRRRPRPVLVSFVLALLFSILSFVLSLPWAAYASWWREKAYGLNNQSLPEWLSEAALGGLIGAVLMAVLLTVIYALIRRAPRTWWLWASGVTGAFLLLVIVISPVFIEPLFNTYTEAPPGPVRDAVVQLARENGVPSDKVYVYDGSRQSDRYTANVSGLFGTARIAMSDAMLKRATLPEVRGVVGHEIGHYAHAHSLWLAGVLSILGVLAFWIIDRTFGFAARLLGAREVAGVGDPVGLPVLSAVFAILGLLATPALNTLVRVVEEDADAYSLRHAREPDGLSAALVKTIEYRAASPGALEEFLFYDHPSVENRLRRAMEWKAAQSASGTSD